MTPEQYLEIERKAEFKSEYRQGEMVALSGARYPHIVIVANAMRELGQQLRGKDCQPRSNDLRVAIPASDRYVYPDLVIVCGQPQFQDNVLDTLLNPKVIVEVLSESTEAYDRGDKFKSYRSVASLQEYLLISSQTVGADLYRRQPDGFWILDAKSSLQDSIVLKSVDCTLALADLYERVEFATAEPGLRRPHL